MEGTLCRLSRHREASVAAEKQSLVIKATYRCKLLVANRVNLKQCKLARLISLDVLVKVKMMEDKYQARSGFHEEECVCLRDAECVRDTSNTRIRTLKVDLQNLPLVAHDAVDYGHGRGWLRQA